MRRESLLTGLVNLPGRCPRVRVPCRPGCRAVGGGRWAVGDHTLRQSSLVMCDPACGPICSIPPSTGQLTPVT
jgi:hypothetical protein